MGSDEITHVYACHIATSTSVKQHKLRKRIAWLSDKEGQGKELISLYLPPTASIDNTVLTLKNQINSDTMEPEDVRNRLQSSLKHLVQHLKPKKEIPENGIAIFAGTFISTGQGKEVTTVEELSPPEPVTTFLYKVDNHFHLEQLREMLRNPRVVGIIVMDSKEASFGLLNGEQLEFIENITSGIPGKSGKGGQSQRRYERQRDMELTYFFHRIAEHATKAFLEDNHVMALIVGGPGTTKDAFLAGSYLHYELKNALLDTINTNSICKNGVREVFNKSSELLKNLCAPEEKAVVHQLLAELAKQDGLATYGLRSVLDALTKGEVEVVLVTDNTDYVEIVVTCKKCELTTRKIVNSDKKAQAIQEMVSRSCERCNSAEYDVLEKDIVDVLEDVAVQTDARVEVISTVSEEKAKLTSLGGVAALLRYVPK